MPKVLGETMVATKDASGKPIMTGMEAIRGQQQDCEFSAEQGSEGMIACFPCYAAGAVNRNTFPNSISFVCKYSSRAPAAGQLTASGGPTSIFLTRLLCAPPPTI